MVDIIKLKGKERGSITGAFRTDLGVKLLENRIAVKDDLIRNIFYNFTADPEIIRFRQDIFRDVIKFPKLKEVKRDIEYSIRGMRSSRDKMTNYDRKLSYSSLAEHIPNAQLKLQEYSEKLSEFEFSSQGLKDIQELFKKLAQAPLLQYYIDVIDAFNKGALEFSISTKEKNLGDVVIQNPPPPEMTPDEKQYDLVGNGTDMEMAIRLVNKSLGKNIFYHIGGLLSSAYATIDQLDFYHGVVSFMETFQEKGFPMVFPEIISEGKTKIIEAYDPVFIARKTGGRWGDGDFKEMEIIPNDISNSLDERLFVITGPNNGGKTRYIKTVGLMYLMAQCGMPIPAKSAKIKPADNIFTHFVKPDGDSRDEGRYKAELKRVRQIIEYATPNSLILVDEPCGGTSHKEGAVQSSEIIDVLYTLGAPTYFTTHLHPVADYVEINKDKMPAARNKQVLIKTEGDKIKNFLYKIGDGAAGKSYGKEVAYIAGATKQQLLEVIDKRVEQGTLNLVQ